MTNPQFFWAGQFAKVSNAKTAKQREEIEIITAPTSVNCSMFYLNPQPVYKPTDTIPELIVHT